ncbi:MAG: sigma-54-dependent Fis family transcriptional regulator, partial [Bdellovibrionales bacterium]|nr:sigma-54-dependent Fis family transcriptional regulator [Bdellovibrionales bacterium]
MTDTILLVDDDADASLSLARALQTTSLDIAVERAATKAHALEIIEQKQPLVVVLDLCLDPQEGVESGFSTLKKSYQIAPHCRVIVLTGHGDFQYGIRALELGAASFLEKPADINHLKILIQDGLAQARIKQKALQTPQGDDSGIHSLLIGKSAAAIILKEEISYAAQNKLPVLLTGETGTGKSLCARTIHDLSSRSQQSFVRFQPGLQSSELVSSELFGHTKGAFTGATSDREGLLKSADSG